MKKIKVGLIGCGFMGSMHANCYKALENVELAAVADIRCENAEKLADGAKIYDSGEALIREADVDIIDICLPTYLHASHALLAMDKVKYLFIEKPVTLTAKESNELLAKQRKTGCQVQVGQVIRFWDEYVYLKGVIDSKEFGEVENANFRRLSPRPTWGWNDWLLKSELSGGAGQDLHIHDVDYMLFAFGKPKKTSTIKNKIGEKNSYVASVCEYDNFSVSVEGTWNLPASHAFEAYYRVAFERAIVEYNGGKLAVYTADGAYNPELQKHEVGNGDFKGGNISDLGGYYNELLYFTQCAAEGKEILRARLADAAQSLEFVLKELS